MKWTRHALQSCTVARRNTSSLLRWALHGAYVTTLRPKRDQSCGLKRNQIYALSEPPPVWDWPLGCFPSRMQNGFVASGLSSHNPGWSEFREDVWSCCHVQLLQKAVAKWYQSSWICSLADFVVWIVVWFFSRFQSGHTRSASVSSALVCVLEIIYI